MLANTILYSQHVGNDKLTTISAISKLFLKMQTLLENAIATGKYKQNSLKNTA